MFDNFLADVDACIAWADQTDQGNSAALLRRMRSDFLTVQTSGFQPPPAPAPMADAPVAAVEPAPAPVVPDPAPVAPEAAPAPVIDPVPPVADPAPPVAEAAPTADPAPAAEPVTNGN